MGYVLIPDASGTTKYALKQQLDSAHKIAIANRNVHYSPS
jgi:hypothetical protein